MFTRRKDEYDVFDGFGRYGLIWTNENSGAPDPEQAAPGEGEAEVDAGRELIGGLRIDDSPAPTRSRRSLIVPAAVLAALALVGALAIAQEEPATRAAADRAARHTRAAAPAPVPAPASARPVPPAPAPPVPRGSRGKVVVLDQTKVPALAKRMARRLEAAGWEVTGTDTFRGAVPATTVYHPADLAPQARALAAALPGISRVKPAFAGIPRHRLTVIVVDDQVVPLADRMLGSLTTR
ncbi:LytR C-terminal domain-containing protein [Embleya sp. NPDC059237]|uniref:LytR C-terminal domain-containing protein n=1 Tax=Embleya sp. NPDC059237 TaxID=3346784 RepID=UPI0036A18DBE